MKRRISKLTAGVSLLLCLAMIGLWVRSYHRTDIVDIRQRFGQGADGRWVWRHLKTWSSQGGLIIRWERHTWTNATPRAVERPRLGWEVKMPGEDFGHPPGAGWRPLMQFEHMVVPGGGAVTADGEFTGAARTGQLRYIGDWFYVPHWAVTVALAAPLAMALVRWRRERRRAARGLCPQCGYDLRASPQRCPECGAPALSH